ncbi:dTDP-4-dehydrorhamnose 3,5-epimerase [Oscillatoria sp. FACHB-1406]|uniref:dTDP-4-dehydrorhamnose 3,5-epimerase n=1 Tax=Oscillatoria sp. FACHB-1406 TaxID=2692846 RepID=UPI001688CBEF|nr:dTDP-4-dehydrorhamnose 3,5-epimerase [Oscillatoria sp. FACHB-1406]MBD2580495.1 dTDP-4-dehydrorhamnose 3,5-epimerase [Oscillatoria sp. FACHB-1406]
MKFTKTAIEGAFIIELELHEDARGFFARTFCVKEFEAQGAIANFVQCNISSNWRKGTLRGMHYQVFPSQETKLVRCTRGAIYDVIVDLRSHSTTYLERVAVELTSDNRYALYVPPQCAHGFQTLEDNTEVLYQMGDFYQPKYDAGVHYSDPTFKIEWPLSVTGISERDLSLPFFNPRL